MFDVNSVFIRPNDALSLRGKKISKTAPSDGEALIYSSTSEEYEPGTAGGAGGAGSDTTAIHDDTASEISVISEKTTPVSADLLIAEDSDDSNNKKKIQIGNLPFNNEYDYYVTAGSYTDLRDALEDGSYATIFVPDGTYTCTDDEATPIVCHANVKKIIGESVNGTIIDSDCGTNTNIEDFLTLNADTVVENVQITNFGTGAFAAFLGANSGSIRVEITKYNNCKVTNLLNQNSRGFENGEAIGCSVVNQSAVGAYGLGIGFYECYGVIGGNTAYVYYLAHTCGRVDSCLAYKSGSAFFGSNLLSNNYAWVTFYGFDGCGKLSNNQVYSATRGYSNCTDVDPSNTYQSCTTPFVSCTPHLATIKDIPEEITATSDGVAASTTIRTTKITTNGDSDLDNVTLANGTEGMVKHFSCVAVGNVADSLKITPASMVGGTQITFPANPLGLGCIMEYAASEGWVVVANNGGTIS